MKKKTIRRSLSLLCSLALILSLAAPAWAAENSVYECGGIRVRVVDGLPSVMPREKYLINNYHHTGASDYNSGTISFVSGEGNTMNLWVDNKGPGTIIINLTVNGTPISPAYTIESGAPGKTIVLESLDGKDLSGNFSVNITSYDGHNMDFYVSARQYQVN